jgi:uncharacterized protein (TIGR02001 family)
VAPRACLAVLLLGSAGPACSQTAVSLKAESDFVFRGVSLSNGKPDASLSLDYDHPSGWYAGASATGAELDPGQRQAALFASVGYARQDDTGLGWEIGITAVHFGADPRYDYRELLAGLIARSWTARLYLSPSYFGSGMASAYAELNGGMALDERWRWFAHAGVLAPIGGGEHPESQQLRFDARVGVGVAIGPSELQLAWTGADHGGFYRSSYAHRHNAWVLSAVYAF